MNDRQGRAAGPAASGGSAGPDAVAYRPGGAALYHARRGEGPTLRPALGIGSVHFDRLFLGTPRRLELIPLYTDGDKFHHYGIDFPAFKQLVEEVYQQATSLGWSKAKVQALKRV